jgi:Sigma-54 interaction domain/AAA domain
MRRVYEEIADYAKHGLNCLLLGPRGVGKEILANFYAEKFRDARHEKDPPPFLSLSCAGLSVGVAQSELFGHVKGAFTGADKDTDGLFKSANGGVLFLDEVGDLPPTVQADLLRALDPGEARAVGATKTYKINEVTVISATEKPKRKIRPSLLDRLGVPINVPGLDERLEDVPAAINFFSCRVLDRRQDIDPVLRDLLDATSTKDRCIPELPQMIAAKLTPLALERIWPGNFRALRVAIDVAVIRAKDLSSVERFADDIVRYFIEHRDAYSKPRPHSHAEPASGTRLVPCPDVVSHEPRLVYSDDVLGAMPGLCGPDMELLLAFLDKTEGRRFRCQDIEHHFRQRGKRKRTIQNWLSKLCKVNPDSGRSVLIQEGPRREIYKLSSVTAPVSQKSKPRRSSFLSLPLDVMWPKAHREHLNIMHALTKEVRVLFIGGDKGVGKTVCLEALGTELSGDRAVYYYPFGDRGLPRFLEVLTEELRTRGVPCDSTAISEDKKNISAAVKSLTPHIKKLFPKQDRPLLLLDNVNLLTDPTQEKALVAMIQQWSDLSFVLAGEKLNDALQKELGATEYPIPSS